MEKSYRAISRRYRPQCFAEVVGQEAIVSTLKNSLKKKQTAAAYLFCGSRGTGKTTLARIVAKALNCEKLTEEQEPCNQCTSCLEIAAGRALDILEIDGASNRGIDDIRGINETVGYSSTNRYKVYIIDEVHMLTKEAFNALLKTLEEPPSNVCFFFATTEVHKVPSTIISRCQRFDLHRIPIETMISRLQELAHKIELNVEEEALRLIASLSEGSLRDAESMLDQAACLTEDIITKENIATLLGHTPKSLFFDLDEAISQIDYSFAFNFAEQMFSSGKELTSFVESLLEHFRDILLTKISNNPQDFSHLSKEERESYAKTASFYTEEQCLYILNFLTTSLQQLGKTAFKKVYFEMIFLELIKSKQRLSIERLVCRLQELEKKIPTSPPPKKEKKAPPPKLVEKTSPLRRESRHDTILRFAAVELEGVLDKNG